MEGPFVVTDSHCRGLECGAATSARSRRISQDPRQIAKGDRSVPRSARFAGPESTDARGLDSAESNTVSLGSLPALGESKMSPMLWAGIVVFVVGLFMLIAGIGPLWLPIVVVLAGIAVIVLGRFKFGSRRTA